MSSLDRKLSRDLWRMKGQAAAIAVVMALGVMMQVMMAGLVVTLDETRRGYYERYRFAEVFAPVTRAPGHLLHQVAALPGVARAEGRISGAARIELPDHAVPVAARALSLPDHAEPALNAIRVQQGRLFNPGAPEEVVLLDTFAAAHGLRPGDSLQVVMNGARRSLRITGLARSPEFLYAAAPGEMVPDDTRFAVLWMSQTSLAAAFDMKGAYSEFLVTLTRGTDPRGVIAALDHLLKPWGAAGAYDREDQFSHRFVSEEISGLRDTAAAIPPVFLGIAAFLLNIVIARMVQAEREEIGLLKAFGYRGAEIGGHYLKLVLAIAVAGALLGALLGILAGRGMVQLYLQFYKFPFLVFRLDPGALALGLVVSVLAAAAGGAVVLRRIFALQPAEAMRPPTPADYRRAGRWARAVKSLDQPTRMVLRRFTRTPFRMLGAVVGITFGMGLSVGMLTIHAGFNQAVALSFDVLDRSEASVTFTHAVSQKTLLELARHPGVLQAEGSRAVAVVLRNGRLTHRGAITGLPPKPELVRALTPDFVPLALDGSGLVLSTALARKLKAQAGDVLTVEVREGAQPVLRLPVTGVSETVLGAPAYMALAALDRALFEPGRISSAALRLDPAQAEAVQVWLRDQPVVAGVSLKSEARAAFERVMNQGTGATRFIMAAVAFTITFGIIYNAARIALAERAHDLASLRVIGFSKGEAAYVLLGELGLVTLLALPCGALLGWGIAHMLAAAYSSDLYTITVVFRPAAFGFAALVVIAGAVLSGLLVKRDVDRADLVAALKTRD
ncbi:MULTISPECIES: ABC transporter permease [unclassified Salipiger]|uniref:ABC transporter permease n=1 Tax=unclassified Salipiger TaxID=2640570 RepID=UPI0013B8E3C6|nr:MULTISPECIES: FtsX-like permease family protein [unclassified Salipiger]NDV47997.1 FtsX-like permease family protein [Salipiger sp. PrR003]NDW33189.1 FtsX-like permease family protein [Salipiger sp. PrR007]